MKSSRKTPFEALKSFLKKTLFRDLPIAQLFGIPLYLKPDYFLGVLISTALFTSAFQGPWATLWALGLVLTANVCITLHELGHSFAARLLGHRTKRISIGLFGGVATLTSTGSTPLEQLFIAVAGPVVSLLIGALFLLTAIIFQIPPSSALANLGTYLTFTGVLNLSWVVFNLFPIFPLDGGRIVAALFGAWMGRGGRYNSVVGHRAIISSIWWIGAPALVIMTVVMALNGYLSAWNGMVMVFVGMFMREQLGESQELLKTFSGHTAADLAKNFYHYTIDLELVGNREVSEVLSPAATVDGYLPKYAFTVDRSGQYTVFRRAVIEGGSLTRVVPIAVEGSTMALDLYERLRENPRQVFMTSVFVDNVLRIAIMDAEMIINFRATQP